MLRWLAALFHSRRDGDGHPADLARLPIAHNLRALSLAEGIRAALSVATIMALNAAVDFPPLREAALGALLTCICDPGGPIRRRVPVLLGFTALGSLMTGGFGLIRDLGPVAAVLAGTLGLFATSFARIYGQAPQQLGALLSTVLVLSLDRALTPASAGVVSAAFAAGSLWATLLTLVIWRVHPFRPARRAVAETYRQLALLVADLRTLLETPNIDDAQWTRHARTHRSTVRAAIEVARGAVLETLRSRGAGSQRAEQSLIRLETADQIFGALIALSDLLEFGLLEERQAADHMLRRVRPLLLVLGRITVTDEPDAHQRIRRSLDAIEAGLKALPPNEALQTVATQIVERLRIAHTLAVPANIRPGADQDGRRIKLTARLLDPVRANLAWESDALRHALRAALAAGPALAVSMMWSNPYSHWLTITIIGTMQPYFALTYTRAIERVAGTAIGGLVAALVGLLCTTKLAMALAMFPLAVAALGVRAVSFGMFMMALTPLIILIVEAGGPAEDEAQIAMVRFLFTLAGGVIAVAANFILWPVREPRRLAADARAAIAAHGRYAEAELAALLGDIQAAAVEPFRRAAGIATNTLEATISRALIEPGTPREQLEAALVIDAALRRVAARVAAMQLDPGLADRMARSELTEWRDWVGRTASLDGLRAELSPRPAGTPRDALARIARQMELIAGAVARLG